MICDCPSEIYHYALPFSPSSSWLHEFYSSELSAEVIVIKGLQAEWGPCSRTVSFDYTVRALACWKDLVTVGLGSGSIIVLDAITGIQTSVLSGHTRVVRSLAFSSDGMLLVSGSEDRRLKLWDIQTGGVVNTYNHPGEVLSISISPDCTTIASATYSKVRLWDVQTGACCCVMDSGATGINFVGFSPMNSKLSISAENYKQQNTGGYQIGPTFRGSGITFSPDGTCLIMWRGAAATIQNSESGAIITKLQAPSGSFNCCCFSPNGKFVAGSVSCTTYVWDITSSDPHLIGTFTGHTDSITSLAFSSSLMSSSNDQSVRFWQIGGSSTDPVAIDSRPTPLSQAPIQFVSLQGNNGIAISSDRYGLVKTWDISTGCCKSSFHIPAKYSSQKDAQLVNDKLIFTHYSDLDAQISIWDAEKGKLLQTLNHRCYRCKGLRISGDGSKVFLLNEKSIQAWSIWTGEVGGEVMFEGEPLYNSLIVDGSMVWLCSKDSQIQGWDFGTPDPSPIPSLSLPPPRTCLSFVNGMMEQPAVLSRIKDTVTGKVVFWLSGRYDEPRVAQWNGRYLIAGYESGEVLILDFIHMIPQ